MTPAPHRWISTFLQAQAAEHGAAHNTQLAYGRDLLAFSDWLTNQSQSFTTATRADVEAYIVACQADGLAQATRARRLSSIRQLYRFAKDEGWRIDNPAIRITGPGATTTCPRPCRNLRSPKSSTPPATLAKAPATTAATPPLSNFYTPPACACPNWSNCPYLPCAATPA